MGMMGSGVKRAPPRGPATGFEPPGSRETKREVGREPGGKRKNFKGKRMRKRDQWGNG